MWNLLNLLNIPLSLFQNMFNARSIRENNAFQSMLVDKQNKAAEAQAEKAYRRSLPSNQMVQMRSAGISDFGAAQAISGGATYNPAPVNTANTEAPQMDLSGALQMISSAAQLSEQRRQFQLVNSDRLDYEKKKYLLKDIYQAIEDRYSDSVNTAPSIKDLFSILNDKEKDALSNPLIQEQVNNYINSHNSQTSSSHGIYKLLKENASLEVANEMQRIQRDILKANKDKTISTEEKELLARDANAALEKLKADLAKKGLENIDESTLESIFKYQGMLETIGNLGTMTTEKALQILENIRNIFL